MLPSRPPLSRPGRCGSGGPCPTCGATGAGWQVEEKEKVEGDREGEEIIQWEMRRLEHDTQA